MNILIIINSFRLGGAEKLCYDLAKKLSQKPTIKVFLYSIGSIETELERCIYSDFKNTTVEVGSFNKPYRKKRVETILKINSFCKNHRIDVVHSNGQSPDFLCRCTKLIGNKSKIVVSIHSTIGYSRFQESIFNHFTNAYVAVSTDALCYAKTELQIKKHIEVVNNGIDLEVYDTIEKKGFAQNILSVGSIQPQKDYLKSARFLAPFLLKHSDIYWYIFGDYEYDSQYCARFLDLCDELGIRDSVVLKGVETNPREIYKYGKVFVLSSSSEGFGISFIEAIVSKHFIFSRNVGVIPEIIKYGGTIHDVDKKESYGCLEDIFSSRVSEVELKVNKEIVSRLYSLENMTDKYLHIYNGVLTDE